MYALMKEERWELLKMNLQQCKIDLFDKGKGRRTNNIHFKLMVMEFWSKSTLLFVGKTNLLAKQ